MASVRAEAPLPLISVNFDLPRVNDAVRTEDYPLISVNLTSPRGDGVRARGSSPPHIGRNRPAKSKWQPYARKLPYLISADFASPKENGVRASGRFPPSHRSISPRRKKMASARARDPLPSHIRRFRITKGKWRPYARKIPPPMSANFASPQVDGVRARGRSTLSHIGRFLLATS